MTVTCDYCAVYIEERNSRWPGYCSPVCRDRARTERQNAARRTRRQDDPGPRWVTQ